MKLVMGEFVPPGYPPSHWLRAAALTRPRDWLQLYFSYGFNAQLTISWHALKNRLKIIIINISVHFLYLFYFEDLPSLMCINLSWCVENFNTIRSFEVSVRVLRSNLVWKGWSLRCFLIRSLTLSLSSPLIFFSTWHMEVGLHSSTWRGIEVQVSYVFSCSPLRVVSGSFHSWSSFMKV